MSKVGIVRFDENGQFYTEMVTVSAEQLDVNCWLPIRFLGGACDRYFVCKYAKKANCQASPSRTAREKSSGVTLVSLITETKTGRPNNVSRGGVERLLTFSEKP